MCRRANLWLSGRAELRPKQKRGGRSPEPSPPRAFGGGGGETVVTALPDGQRKAHVTSCDWDLIEPAPGPPPARRAQTLLKRLADLPPDPRSTPFERSMTATPGRMLGGVASGTRTCSRGTVHKEIHVWAPALRDEGGRGRPIWRTRLWGTTTCSTAYGTASRHRRMDRRERGLGEVVEGARATAVVEALRRRARRGVDDGGAMVAARAICRGIHLLRAGSPAAPA